MLAEAAEAALLRHSSQRPEPRREPAPFNTSVIRETIPLTIPTSPARPKPNKFVNITREIVETIEEEDKQGERPRVNFFTAVCVGKEKTPYYSKIIDNVSVYSPSRDLVV